jgi:hypothetical protein
MIAPGIAATIRTRDRDRQPRLRNQGPERTRNTIVVNPSHVDLPYHEHKHPA